MTIGSATTNYTRTLSPCTTPATCGYAQAGLPLATYAAGSYDIVVHYNGDSNWLAVDSSHLTQVIN